MFCHPKCITNLGSYKFQSFAKFKFQIHLFTHYDFNSIFCETPHPDLPECCIEWEGNHFYHMIQSSMQLCSQKDSSIWLILYQDTCIKVLCFILQMDDFDYIRKKTSIRMLFLKRPKVLYKLLYVNQLSQYCKIFSHIYFVNHSQNKKKFYGGMAYTMLFCVLTYTNINLIRVVIHFDLFILSPLTLDMWECDHTKWRQNLLVGCVIWSCNRPIYKILIGQNII